MNKFIFFNLLSIIILLSSSCSFNDVLDENEIKQKEEKVSKERNILSFNSKEEFNRIFEEYDLSYNKTRGLPDFESSNEVYENSNDSLTEKIGFLVPNEKMRHFLNKDLEIIINDTLYKVIKNGTLFANIAYKNELRNAVRKIDQFSKIGKGLKGLGHVSLINTFNNWDEDNFNPIEDNDYFESHKEDVIIPTGARTRANSCDISREELDNFPVIGTVNVSLVDKIIHFNPAYMKHEKLRLNSNHRRKFYVSVYKYDYKFGVTIGVDCKIMKKMWYGGWAHVKNWREGIYYGISSLIIRQSIKHKEFDDFMKFMKPQLNNQWKNINTYKYNTYIEATKSLKDGIVNNWVTVYNKRVPESPYVIPIIGESINNALGENKFSNTVAKAFDKFLINKGIKFFSSISSNSESKKIDFLSENDNAIYHFFCNDVQWNNGNYKIKDTFLRYYRNITLNFTYRGNGTFSDIKQDITDNDFIGEPEICYCEGVVYTKDGDGWIGARILKNWP